jgi:hypothetical protein
VDVLALERRFCDAVGVGPPDGHGSMKQSLRLREPIGVVEPRPFNRVRLPSDEGLQQGFNLPVLEQPEQQRRNVFAPGALRCLLAYVSQEVLVGLAERSRERPGGLPIALLQRIGLGTPWKVVDEQHIAQFPRVLVEGEQRAHTARPGIFPFDEALERVRHGPLRRDRVAARQHPPKMVRRRHVGQRTCLVAADKTQKSKHGEGHLVIRNRLTSTIRAKAGPCGLVPRRRWVRAVRGPARGTP